MENDEIRKLMGGGRHQRDHAVDLVCKDLHLHDVRLEDYLYTKYALWLDLRTTEDNKLHGSGRTVGDGSGGINIQIHKEAGENKQIFICLFSV